MKTTDLNYPMKYAPMKVSVCTGHDDFGYPLCEPYCYIAAPCYLTGERKKYLGSGSSETKYEVVFVAKLDYIDSLAALIEVPNYNFNGDCINSTIVGDISSSKEDMIRICEEKSRELQALQLCGVPIKDYSKAANTYLTTISRCYDVLDATLEKNSHFQKIK